MNTTIRLIDLAGYTQECAGRWVTIQNHGAGIYNDARRKLADALVNGKMLYRRMRDIGHFANGNAGCGRKMRQLTGRK